MTFLRVHWQVYPDIELFGPSTRGHYGELSSTVALRDLMGETDLTPRLFTGAVGTWFCNQFRAKVGGCA